MKLNKDGLVITFDLVIYNVEPNLESISTHSIVDM